MSSALQSDNSRRNSAIELLRIISMLMIVFHHFSVHGEFSYDTGHIVWQQHWLSFIAMGGKIGVNIFVFISGYYMILDDGPVFQVKRLLKIWGQLFFYSAVILLFFVLLGQRELSFKAVLKLFVPVTLDEWWFASVYFVLCLIHPFLNMLLTGLSRENYQKLLVLCIFCWCVIPTLTAHSYQGNYLVWFVCLYSLAGYIRLFGLGSKFKHRHYLIMSAVFSALTYLLNTLCSFAALRWPALTEYCGYLYSHNSAAVLLISLSMFMSAITAEPFNSKLINSLSAGCFGVYLLHDSNLTRPYIWHDLFKCSSYSHSNMLIPYSIFTVAAIFICGIALDYIRRRIFEPAFLALVDRYAEKILYSFKKACTLKR